MKENNNSRTFLLCLALILVAVASRILNAEMHWYHFGPMVAMSLFSGAVLKNKSYSFILPLAAYFISDIYLQLVHQNGFYGISQFFVYGAMALVVLLGVSMKKVNVTNVLGFTIGGSLLFWLISNFGVFLGGYYGGGLQGLTATYVAAIPFYKSDFVSNLFLHGTFGKIDFATELFLNGIIGDVLFSGILFGAYAIIKNKVIAPKAIA